MPERGSEGEKTGRHIKKLIVKDSTIKTGLSHQTVSLLYTADVCKYRLPYIVVSRLNATAPYVFTSYLPVLSHLFKIHVLAYFIPDYDADDHCNNSLNGHNNQPCKSDIACLYIACDRLNLEECHGK